MIAQIWKFQGPRHHSHRSSTECPCTICRALDADKTKNRGAITGGGPNSPLGTWGAVSVGQQRYITGIRFYKSAAKHRHAYRQFVNGLGTLLASATFTERALQAGAGNFSNPVSVTANTVYVASYHTNCGHFQ